MWNLFLFFGSYSLQAEFFLSPLHYVLLSLPVHSPLQVVCLHGSHSSLFIQIGCFSSFSELV